MFFRTNTGSHQGRFHQGQDHGAAVALAPGTVYILPGKEPFIHLDLVSLCLGFLQANHIGVQGRHDVFKSLFQYCPQAIHVPCHQPHTYLLAGLPSRQSKLNT